MIGEENFCVVTSAEDVDGSKPITVLELAPVPQKHVEANQPKKRKRGRPRKQLPSVSTPPKVEKKDLLPPAQRNHLFKPGQSGNPDGRRKYKHFSDSIERVFTAKSKDPEDQNQLDKIFRLIREKMVTFLNNEDLDTDDLHLLVQDIEIMAARFEGKPRQETEGESGGTPSLTINIGTRFSPTTRPEPQGEVLEAEVVKNA